MIGQLIQDLRLEPHPEGGYYRETYRASGQVGDRAYSTAIYFLLESGGFSAFHRIKSDEVWHFYQGVSLNIYVLDEVLTTIHLGGDPQKGEVFQAVVPAGRWLASRPAEARGYSLVGCTVAPGFDFADFEMAQPDTLVQAYPAHAELIRGLTRPPTTALPQTPGNA